MKAEAGFEYSTLVDELRRHTTEWLCASRVEAVSQQRRFRVRELAITAVLGERGAFDESVAATDGVSVRHLRETLETARALENLPQVAAAAYDGALSDEQLVPLVQLADEDSDAEWARRGAACAPVDLARLARTKTKPTADEAGARRARRELAMRWRRDNGMLAGRFELPDLDGALFARTRMSKRYWSIAIECRSRPPQPDRCLSPKISRAVLLRDGHCRWPGCTRRHGLQVHHLWPRSWGGGDDLATSSPSAWGGGTDHHPQLAPRGCYLLLGNPNRVDGIRLVHRDQFGEQIRAGPDAA